MRILMVSEDVPAPAMGGLAKHALTLARALARAGHQVDFMGSGEFPLSVAGEEGEFGGRFFGELSGHYAGWKEVSLGMYMPPRRSWMARRFARLIMRRARDYDVVHYHGHVPNLARYLPADLNFVQTRHDQGSECLLNTRFKDGRVCTESDPRACGGCRTASPNAAQRMVSGVAVRIYRREVAEAFLRHKTVFVSDMLRRNFARIMGEEDWGVTVHNFIDLPRLRQVQPERPGPSEQDAGGISIFTAGKLYPAKGIEDLLRELAPRMPDGFHLSVAGDGVDLPRLRQQYAGERISFLGWCSQQKVLALTAGADAVVVPSVWEEPCATTILEALALGRPTFALARGGTPELARYAAPGQLRLFDNMRELVAALRQFRAGQHYPAAASAAASVDHAVQELLALYRQPPGRLARQAAPPAAPLAPALPATQEHCSPGR